MISRARGTSGRRASGQSGKARGGDPSTTIEGSSRLPGGESESAPTGAEESPLESTDPAGEPALDADAPEPPTEGSAEPGPDGAELDAEASAPEAGTLETGTLETGDSEGGESAALGEEEEALPRLEGERLRSCIEAILFASPDPVSRRRLYRLIPEAENADIREALLELEGELLSTHRGYTLVEEGSGLRLLSKAEFAPYVSRLRGEKRRVRLSSAAFETLAVIAYRQPARRADLEAIRGVQCGAILKNLMEWNLIRVVGHDDSPGRPLLYGTTGVFLEMLGLSELGDLPEPERLRERGEDRGLQVLDRIIEEGGGSPSVAEGSEPSEEPMEPESAEAAPPPEPPPSPEAVASTPEPAVGSGTGEVEVAETGPEDSGPEASRFGEAGDADFDLDLDADEEPASD
ncbi:MAG: SMC-Scp complex subunit ScpB [Planctomycetota bacterium]